jgi:sugar phosphate isomerase/epimerase
MWENRPPIGSMGVGLRRTGPVRNDFTLAGYLDFLGEIGAEGLELEVPWMYGDAFRGTLMEYRDDWEGLRRMVEGAGIQIGFIGGRVTPVQADREAHQAQITNVRRAIEFTASCEQDVLRLMYGRKPSRLPREQGIRRVIEFFGELMEHCEEHQVILAPENFSTFVNDADTMLHICDEVGSPYMSYCLDTANLCLTSADLEETHRQIMRLVPGAACVHVRDSRCPRRPDGFRMEPLGEGDLDWTAIMSALRDAGHHRLLAIEAGTPDDHRRSVRYLKGLLDSPDF